MVIDTVIPGGLRVVRVWDLPTRIFHWALAVCFIGSLGTGSIGGKAMAWHFGFGYVVFTLLAFRMLWGVVGGRWSRFSSFIYGPAAVLRYVRGRNRREEHHDVGHSPLASGSVFALLLFLSAQVGSGLVADDEIANTGPLVKFVSSATSSALTTYHGHVGRWILLGLVVLHVAAIVFYRVKRRTNLVTPMISGDKLLPADVPAAADSWANRVLAACLLATCAAGVAKLVSLGV